MVGPSSPEPSPTSAWKLTFALLSSDYGFKLSEDLSLQICVPDPEFTGDLYAPPEPCPVGATYRRSKGFAAFILLAQMLTWLIAVALFGRPQAWTC